MTRLIMRRLERRDLSARVAWFNTPEIHSAMPLDYPMSYAGTEKWYDGILLKDDRRDFAADIPSDGSTELVAMFGLVNINWRQQRAELYIVVDPSAHNRGLGTQCVRWLCNYGFGHLGLHRVYLYTLATNVSVSRFYERLGFRFEGTLRQHHFHHGVFVDRHVYGLLDSEWRQCDWSKTCALPIVE